VHGGGKQNARTRSTATVVLLPSGRPRGGKLAGGILVLGRRGRMAGAMSDCSPLASSASTPYPPCRYGKRGQALLEPHLRGGLRWDCLVRPSRPSAPSFILRSRQTKGCPGSYRAVLRRLARGMHLSHARNGGVRQTSLCPTPAIGERLQDMWLRPSRHARSLPGVRTQQRWIRRKKKSPGSGGGNEKRVGVPGGGRKRVGPLSVVSRPLDASSDDR
jgi:hypothetical protein